MRQNDEVDETLQLTIYVVKSYASQSARQSVSQSVAWVFVGHKSCWPSERQMLHSFMNLCFILVYGPWCFAYIHIYDIFHGPNADMIMQYVYNSNTYTSRLQNELEWMNETGIVLINFC